MEGDLSLLSDDFEDVLLSPHEIELKQPFRLLDLPPELWLKICEIAVTHPGPIVVTQGTQNKDQMALLRQPAITRTNRLLRSESLPMFYRINTFKMTHPYGVECPRYWMHAIGSANLAALGSIVIECRDRTAFWVGCFKRAGITATIETVPPPSGQVQQHYCRFDGGHQITPPTEQENSDIDDLPKEMQ